MRSYNSGVKSVSARRLGTAWLLGVALAVSASAAAPQSPPVPKPFPGTTPTPPVTSKPSTPATPGPATPVAPPQPARTGEGGAAAYAYPNAEFIDSFDAGRGQRFYLYGTNASFSDTVLYYKGALKVGGGRELMRTPAMQQFDLGRFDEEAMAYPPSVVVKDYTWNNSQGYLAVRGTTEKRYKTIIQIVPPVAGK
jgi:hypothetical protein